MVSRTPETTPALDLTQCKRPSVCPSAAAFIFQPHSSDDDRVHSATVQDSSFARLRLRRLSGSVTTKRFQFSRRDRGNFIDECHVDKSGNWLMLLEVTPSGSLNNRVVDLRNGTITTIDDVQGALGHLDMGYGYAVGADNWNPLPNATILLKFPVTRTQRPIGPVVHFNKRWDIAAANHIAHGNARAGAPETQYRLRQQRQSRRRHGGRDRLLLARRESVCGWIARCPRGGAGDDRSRRGRRPRRQRRRLSAGSRRAIWTSPAGYFIWTTNMGGDRLDAFLVKVPVTR